MSTDRFLGNDTLAIRTVLARKREQERVYNEALAREFKRVKAQKLARKQQR